MAGNLTQRQTASGTTTYSYTAQHRLAVAETPDAVVGYAYDAAGRRIMRTEAAVAAGSAGDAPLQKDAVATGAHRSVYRYDGASRMVSSRVEMELTGVAEVEGLVKPVNPGGGRYRPAPSAALPGGTTASSRSTFSEVSVGRRTLSVTGPEGSRFLSHDVLGSVRTATGTTGMVIEHYQYDAYGETLSGATNQHQPYGYNGKPRDPATGLTDYGFRDYLPQAGRFVTVDPVKDGVNWYAYVNADPVNFVDAWGLAAADPGDGTAGEPDPWVVDPSVDPFDDEGFVDQFDFDARFGLAEDRRNTESCQSTAIINLYVELEPDGVPLEVLDKTVAEWRQEAMFDGKTSVPMSATGVPQDFNAMSNILAKNLGREELLARVYDPENNWEPVSQDSREEFLEGEYPAAIERQERPNANPLVTRPDQHFTSLVQVNDEYVRRDSAGAGRDGSEDYTIVEWRPLQWVPTQ